jgi:hypothetical protein
MSSISKQARKRAKKAQDAGLLANPIQSLSAAGFRSEWAFAGGFISIGLSFAAWLLSRGKKDDRAQSDRWGIFVGHWAPTFFALGIALQHEER